MFKFDKQSTGVLVQLSQRRQGGRTDLMDYATILQFSHSVNLNGDNFSAAVCKVKSAWSA